MKQNQNLLTIIVPIYNVELYLRECLDGFVNQTNQNFNVLLIDDGSKDSSGAIADEYVKKYPSLFKCIHQENKGLGGARNTGLANATNEYIMFFDSDDFMANRAVESFYNHLNKLEQKCDIIFFNPCIYDMATKSYEPWHDSDFFKNVIFKDKEIINVKDYPILFDTEASVCRAFWRLDFLKRANLHFLEHTRWEDVPPHFVIMHEARYASYMDYEGAYFYRTGSGNQITSGSGKSRLDMKYIFDEIYPYFTDASWSKIEKSHMLGFLSNYLFWSIHVIDDEYRVEFVNICHDFFKKITFSQYMHFFRHSASCLRNRLLIWYLKSPSLYKVYYSKERMNKRMKIFNRFKKVFKK